MHLIDLSSSAFWLSLLSIILIDIVLAGDNSVVIAMAVQSLPKKQRTKGILFGAGAAVLLRVIFTFFAAQMLQVSFVKLIGGALILWIAVKLMLPQEGHDASGKKAGSVWQAVWIILVADVTMSLDNILAVAGASHGNLFLLLFGFGLSIPLVVFTSTLISKLMSRYPVIMWVGAAILGKVGGEMMLSDPFVVRTVLQPFGLVETIKGALHPNHYLLWTTEAVATLGVIAVALILRKMKAHRHELKVDVPGNG